MFRETSKAHIWGRFSLFNLKGTNIEQMCKWDASYRGYAKCSAEEIKAVLRN
jgi:hypothetical protein